MTLLEACKRHGIQHPYTFADLGKAVHDLKAKAQAFDTENEPHVKEALREYRRYAWMKTHDYMSETGRVFAGMVAREQ